MNIRLFGNYEMDSPGDYLKSLVITYHHTSVADKTAFNSIAIVGCPNGSRTEIQICLSDSVYQHIRKGTVFAVAGGTGNDQTLRLQLYHYGIPKIITCEILALLLMAFTGDSFLEFLENWAEKLAGYPIVNQTILK